MHATEPEAELETEAEPVLAPQAHQHGQGLCAIVQFDYDVRSSLCSVFLSSLSINP